MKIFSTMMTSRTNEERTDTRNNYPGKTHGITKPSCNKCNACGKLGHGWRDNPACAKKLRKRKKQLIQKLKEEFEDSESEANSAMDTDDDTNGHRHKNERRVKFLLTAFHRKKLCSDLPHDVNLILHEGAPTSTGRVLQATQLANVLRIPFQLSQPR